MNDDPLLPEEQDRLARARIPVAPPPGAEDRLVGALRERGLLRRRASSAIGWIAAAAAVVLIVAAWMLWPQAVPSGPRFILLLYAGSDPIQGTAADRRREYADWARTVASRGVAISGEELTGESRTLGATSCGTSTNTRTGSSAAISNSGVVLPAVTRLPTSTVRAATVPANGAVTRANDLSRVRRARLARAASIAASAACTLASSTTACAPY